VVGQQERAERDTAEDPRWPLGSCFMGRAEATGRHDQECATSTGRCMIGVARRLRNL
jgi:hypothetical protein